MWVTSMQVLDLNKLFLALRDDKQFSEMRALMYLSELRYNAFVDVFDIMNILYYLGIINEEDVMEYKNIVKKIIPLLRFLNVTNFEIKFLSLHILNDGKIRLEGVPIEFEMMFNDPATFFRREFLSLYNRDPLLFGTINIYRYAIGLQPKRLDILYLCQKLFSKTKLEYNKLPNIKINTTFLSNSNINGIYYINPFDLCFIEPPTGYMDIETFFREFRDILHHRCFNYVLKIFENNKNLIVTRGITDYECHAIIYRISFALKSIICQNRERIDLENFDEEVKSITRGATDENFLNETNMKRFTTLAIKTKYSYIASSFWYELLFLSLIKDYLVKPSDEKLILLLQFWDKLEVKAINADLDIYIKLTAVLADYIHDTKCSSLAFLLINKTNKGG